MGAIADLPVPEGGAVAALPVPDAARNAVAPEQLDAENFSATAGPFRRGLRSGLNRLGSDIETLVGQTGEALSATQFANDRFKAADEYAHFADAVAPPVRDPSAVRDAESLAKFVAGTAGEGLASSFPAIAGGIALRRPVFGAFAGMFPQEAGSQVRTLRDDPQVMANHTPGEILANAAEKGAATSAINAAVGAPAQAVGKVFKPATAAQSLFDSVTHAAIGNAAGAGASDIVGQEFHHQLNPDTELDWDQSLKSAISAAAGGAAIGIGGHLAGAIPGAAARSASELKQRLQRGEAPPDDAAVPTEQELPHTATEEDVVNYLKGAEERTTKFMGDVHEAVKNNPTAAKFKDYATDPEARAAFNDEIQNSYNNSEYKPKVDGAVESAKTWWNGAQKWLADRGKNDGDVKKSEMRTAVDDDVHDTMMEHMPPHFAAMAKPEQLLELSGVIKHMAENPEYFSETGVPQGLKRVFGDKFQPLLDAAVDRVHSPGPARTAAKASIKSVFDHQNVGMDEAGDAVNSLVRNNLRPEYLANKELRNTAISELAPQLLHHIQNEGDTSGNFHGAMREAFGDKTDAVMRQLEDIRSKRQITNDKAFEGSVDEGMDTGPAKNPAADERLNKSYTDPEAAAKARDELYAEYGRRNVEINHTIDPDTHAISLHVEPADRIGLHADELKGVRESATQNRSGLENGILTVNTDNHPSGYKVNMIKLTSAMMRREGQMLPENGMKYVADMFKRGIASLMATDGFRSFKQELEGGQFPDDAKVAYYRGKTYTYGEIKKANAISKMDLHGITKEGVIEEANRITNAREARKMEPLEHSELRKKAIEAAIAKSKDRAMEQTLLEPTDLERGEPGSKLKPEGPRTFEEDTGQPIGEGGTAPAAGPKVSEEPSGEPHGKGPISPKGAKEVALTKQIQDAFNSVKKFSTQNIAKGEQSEAQRQGVRDYVEHVLGPDAKVVFEKMAHAGEFANLKGEETLRISLDASDPASVGFHEAAHAFISRLIKANPKAAHILTRAASAAPIVARLRELLQNHPEALKQLKNPEERLAYMYQFWASGEKGLLQVGPNTRTWFEKVKDFFSKISAVWSDQAASLQQTQRANDLLLAFHNGEFADRNTVQRVLHERFPEAPEEKLRRVWPGLGKFMDRMVYTAGSAVRDMNIPELTNIIDKFHTVNGDINKETGFNQVKHVVYDKYMNKVLGIVEGMDEGQRSALLKEMQTEGGRSSPAAKALTALNKELFDYMKEKGVKTWDPKNPKDYVDLKEIKDNYWHRIPDQDYLRSEEGHESFVKMLRKNGVDDAEGVWQKWTQDIDSGRPKEGDSVVGLSFFTPQVNERKLQNIKNSDMAPFLNKDLVGTMSQYIQRAARRAEYTQRFGNRGEAIEAARKAAVDGGATPAQLDTFDASVQAHEGTLGAQLNPKLKNIYGGLMTYQNIRLLPLQIFSSLVDPGGIIVRGGTLGDAFGGFTRGLRELFGNKNDESERLATTVGAISASMDNTLSSSMASAQYLPKLTRKINETFFKYNGMESWNRSMRIAAAQAAHDFIVRHVESPTEHSERFLAELNLKKDEVKIKDGKLDIENDKIGRAINQWVDEAILRPTASHRPIYMSDPHWMLISHLKQYSYLFQKVILSRVVNEIKHGNYSPGYALAGYVPAIIAADMMRVAITPGSADDTARKGWTAADWIWSGIQRAGLFGPGQMGISSVGDARQGRMFGQSVAGPTVEQLLNFVKAGAQRKGLGSQTVDAIPGLRMFKGQQSTGSAAVSDE